MRHRHLFARILALTCLVMAGWRTASADDTLTVAYTGKLLGYARIPDRQPQLNSPTACTMPSGGAAGADTEVALALVERLNAQPGALIVGMGDNFAPELDARRFLEGTLKELYTWDHTRGGPWLENNDGLRRLLPDIAAGHGTIPMDNVACFFQLAGYTALVPGKHDFYYGPERLREFARFLATPPAGHPDRRVQMLAGNLIVDTKDVKAAPRLSPALKPEPEYKTSVTGTKIDLPDVVLPVMREFTIRGVADLIDTATGNTAVPDATPKDSITVEREFTFTGAGSAAVLHDRRYLIRPNLVSAWVCPGKALHTDGENNPDSFPIPTSTDKNPCWRLTELKQAAGKAVSLNAVFRLEHQALERDRNYGLCVALPKSPDAKEFPYYCAPFTVRAPFFEYQHDVISAGPRAAEQKLPDPYVITQVRRGDAVRDVAVFGVVDPDLPEHIGALNYSWVNDVRDYETAMKTIDPKSALQQQMQHCWMIPQCRGARKVLLAQMPQFKAVQLAGRLTRGWFAGGRAVEERGDDWFDLVISQADEELATGEENRDKFVPLSNAEPGPGMANANGWTPTKNHSRSPFVVVPDPVHVVTGQQECAQLGARSSDRCVRLIVQHAELTPSEGDRLWTLHHHSDARIVLLATDVGTRLTLLDAARQALAAMTKVPAAAVAALGAAGTLQQLALESMRRDQDNADMAMLQQRDIFDAQWHAGQLVDAATLQSILDRVFWKGDYTLEIFVTGAAIKDALKKSAQFEANDNNSLSIDDELGRALVTRGLQTDSATKENLIDGQRIDDARMYGVAVSDYVGMGDTGYPELFAKPPVPPDRVADIRHFSRLATELCRSISTLVPALTGAACHSAEPGLHVDAQWQLDGSDQRPSDTTPGLTPARVFQQWFTPSRPRSAVGARTPPTEAEVQSRSMWNVILDSAQFAYTLNSRNLTAKEASDEFSGVQTTRVTSPDSRSVAIAYQLHAVRLGQFVDRFANSDLSYTRELTQQKDDSFLTNQKSNQVNGEAGYYFHVWPAAKQISGLKALLSARIESQPAAPLTTLGDPLPKVQTFRRTLLVAKAGARLEGDHRWIEAGWEKGALLHSVYEYDFQGTPCSAVGVGSQSLANCIKANQIASIENLVIQQRTREQAGFFLNAHAQLPLPFGNKLAVLLDNRAELFLHTPDDASIDTRAYENFVASLRIPIVGNLSVAPKVDWYLFTNKVDFHTIRSLQMSFGVDYRFDWHQGLRWGRALRYANPAATPQ